MSLEWPETDEINFSSTSEGASISSSTKISLASEKEHKT